MPRELIPPLLTPLLGDVRVDTARVCALAERVLDAGATGVFVLGSTGEGPYLTPDQRLDVVRAVTEAARGRAPVYVGVSDTSARRVLEAMRALSLPGVEAFVVTLPYYGACSEPDAQRSFFTSLANKAPRPLILYNIPQAVHASIQLEVVRDALLDHSNVTAMKDSSGDAAYLDRALEMAGGRDFFVLQGAEPLAALTLLLGGRGLVPGMANVAPQLYAGMIRAADEGDTAMVLELQRRSNALGRMHAHGHWLACLKTAASLLGLCDPALAAPVAPLAAEAKARVRSVLEQEDLLSG